MVKLILLIFCALCNMDIVYIGYSDGDVALLYFSFVVERD